MLEKQGGGNAVVRIQAAGRTAALEVSCPDSLGLSDGKALPGTLDKLQCNVEALTVDDRGPAGQNGMAVAADQVRRNTGGGKAAKLLGTERYPVTAGQGFHAGAQRSDLPVIAGSKPGKACTDQTDFRL